MNLGKIPTELHHLAPLVQKWGIGDDAERTRAVRLASTAELEELVAAADASLTGLNSWLCGAAADERPVSDEYAGFTAFTMAAEHAEIVLERRRREQTASADRPPAG